jgi:transposase
MGRKNYYGSGSLWAGRLAAMLFSLFATVTRCRLNPRLWLSWYLESCATAGGNVPDNVAAFLPWSLSPQRRESLMLDRDDTS